MKKIFLTLIILYLFSFLTNAQTQIIIYSQNSENFYLYLNNVKQNDTAKANVTVENLALTVYMLKVEFEDVYTPAFEKKIYLNPNAVVSYALKKKKNGTYALRMVSQTTTNADGDLNLTMWGTGFSLDLNELLDPDNYSDNGYYNGTKPPPCVSNIDSKNFENIRQAIAAKITDSEKYSMAKQVAGSNCLKATQVKDIIMLFSQEKTKIDFAKYAYHHTSDIANYAVVFDALTYSSSKDELNKYINSLK